MNEKSCGRCGEAKCVDQFAKNGKLGRHPVCKQCRAQIERDRRASDPERARALEAARYAKNSEGKKRSIARYYQKNAQKIIGREKERYRKNAERIKIRVKSYREGNKEKIREWNGTRRAKLRQAMPDWVDRRAVSAIYRKASELWAATGVEHHVDHVVPLSGKVVCGLHVPWNLQILTAAANLRKGQSLERDIVADH